ncbi:MAG: gluconokinase [Ktedonobacteraceae bacterium]
MTQKASAANQNPAPPYILALDVGTSSTRTLLFDATGNTLPNVLAQRPYQLRITNEGEVSVDPDALMAVVEQTIDDALEMAGPLATHIGAVALDTFWHGLMGVDADNHPLTPLILWEDTRPQDAAIELRKQLDEKAIHTRTGARFHASYWPAKLRWMATHAPEAFSRVAQWQSFGDYLYRHFLGRSVCSLSMASGTGMLQTRARTWDTELMEVLDVRPEQLPPLGDLHERVQGLTPKYASAWPTLRNVPWFPAIGDGAAACVGSGCASLENWSLTIGTSGAIRVVVPPEQVIPPMSLWLYLIDAKRAVLGGALSEGGNLLNWLDSVLALPVLAEAENLAAALQPDGHGVTILPFISGERSPGWHASARMTISGIQAHSSPADLLRAGMEALAYQLAVVYEQVYQTLQIGKTAPRVIGSGGALLGSMTLEQIVADTLGVAVYPSLDHEASARGTALLALEAMGILPDVAQVPAHLKPPVQPDAAKHIVYRKGAERQQKLYQALLEVK